MSGNFQHVSIHATRPSTLAFCNVAISSWST
jgi:hypothetical protein